MTKGSREARVKARMERQVLGNGSVRGKRQFVRESKSGGEYIKENVSNAGELEAREDLIIGRNATMGVLKSDRTIECVYISNGNMGGSIKVTINVAREKGLVLKEVDRKKLDAMSNGTNHQRVTALVTPFRYYQIVDMLNDAKEKGEDPFIIVLNEIGDLRNLDSIIRTAGLCGVHRVIVPKGRNTGITSTIYKCSVGAIECMKVAKVTNINSVIDRLKESELWAYDVDIAGEEYSYQVNFNGPCIVVVGSEGKGISKLTLEKCDKLMEISVVGKINSLNASATGDIMIYEILKGRLLK